MRRKTECIFSWTIFWSLLIGAAGIPPGPRVTTLSENVTVPLEFPNFNQNYTFVDNSSIRENLASHFDIDTEVDDLLGKDEPITSKNETIVESNSENTPPETENEQKVKPDQENEAKEPENDETPETEEPVEDTGKIDHEPAIVNPPENVGIKTVAEWIEDDEDPEDDSVVVDDKNPEEETVESSTAAKTSKTVTTATTVEKSSTEVLESLEPYQDGVPVINGSVAGILVGVFLLVCIVGYTALILWRRSLEMRYGSRQMLVTDDMFDPDDIKHFSI